jgi:hypothetical protein
MQVLKQSKGWIPVILAVVSLGTAYIEYDEKKEMLEAYIALMQEFSKQAGKDCDCEE